VVSSAIDTSVVSFDELANPSFITPGFGPGERIDPYWSMVWQNPNGGPEILWRTPQSERIMADVGVRVPMRCGGLHTQDEAVALLPRRRTRLVTLGTINLWHTMTSQQLVAITGKRGLNSPRSGETGLLFDAGLIQRGRSYYGGWPIDEIPEMFRPNNEASKVNLRGLRYSDWLGATLGGSPVKGHQYDRHNILMTELSLRAAEMCPLRSALGEAVSSWTQVFGPTLKPNPYRSADAVWIRDDGLKIALEMTANFSPSTASKIDQLAELLARDSVKSTIVLFVVAADPKGGRESDVTMKLRQAVKKSAHSSMARILADVENRMVIAKWEDWFPAPELVSREFVGLKAHRYVASDDDWTPINVLDPFDTPFPGADRPEVRASFKYLNDVFGAPWWLRQEHGADHDSYLLEKAGFPGV
jgi:hypothetical protein